MEIDIRKIKKDIHLLIRKTSHKNDQINPTSMGKLERNMKAGQTWSTRFNLLGGMCFPWEDDLFGQNF